MKTTKQTSESYQQHLSSLRGFSDGAGTKAINTAYEKDQDYMSGYIAGQLSKRMFAEASAKAFGIELAEIKAK